MNHNPPTKGINMRLPIVYNFDFNSQSDIVNLSAIHSILHNVIHEQIVKDKSWYRTGRPVIIVKYGQTLEQASYHDISGVMVQYRISPFYENNKQIQQITEQFENELARQFHKPETYRQVQRVVDASDPTNVSLYFTHNVYSIGD